MISSRHHLIGIRFPAFERLCTLISEDPDAELMYCSRRISCIIWPVSTRVNNVRNQEADLLDPVEPEEPGLL